MPNIKIYSPDEKRDIIKNIENPLKILVFTEGTIIGPRSLIHHFNHAAYVPIKNSVNKLREWEQQGAQILYLTSRRKEKQVGAIKEILKINKFPGNILFYREGNEKYSDVVELISELENEENHGCPGKVSE